MNTLLSSLARVCREHPIARKLLLVPSLSAGHQLLTALASAGIGWLNLHPVTVNQVARQLVFPLPEGEEELTAGLALTIVDELLHQLAESGQLSYFAHLYEKDSVRLAEFLWRAMCEMRLAGIAAADLNEADFLVPSKGRELAALLQAYEQRLQSEGLWDEARLLQAALAIADSSVGQRQAEIWLIPEPLELDLLSRRLVDCLTQGQVIVLASDPIYGLELPFRYSYTTEAAAASDDASTLSYLLQPAAARGEAPQLRITRAYGAANELKSVLRYLQSQGIPWDQATICYTQGEVYQPLLYALAVGHDIPVTFGEGVPTSFTRPGRLCLGLLKWLEEDWSSEELYRLLVAGDMVTRHAPALARLLRQTGIRRGRARYRAYAEQGRGETVEEDGPPSRLEKAYGADLRQLLLRLLKEIPAADAQGLVPWRSLCYGLINLLRRFAPQADPLDQQALPVLTALLAEAAVADGSSYTYLRASKRLRLWLAGQTVAASSPQPGHLHAVGYSRAGWGTRPYTFVVGLSEDLFPGRGAPDPILLDEERSRVSPALLQQGDAPLRNLYRMLRFLAACRGFINLSFPSHDPTDNRPLAPASLLLDAYRLASGQPDADFSLLLRHLPPPAGYLPRSETAAFSEEEWWLYQLSERALDANSLAAAYQGVAAGALGQAQRESKRITLHDGRLTAWVANPAGSEVLSVTQLESLARCPFAYFLRYVLGVQPLPVPAVDGWLDPLQRGSLLHRIYCLYQREAYGVLGRPDAALLQSIAQREVEALRADLLPPSPAVYQQEWQELQRSLTIFWRMEAEQLREAVPRFFEVPFGLGEAEVQRAGLGLADPVVIRLPSGRNLQLRGSIDRIDQVGEHSYQVWDFKTGSASSYPDEGYLERGQHLQHALYSIVAEQILRTSRVDPAAEVVVAGYVFPTERGEGRRVGRSQQRRRDALTVADRLLELRESGIFHSTDNKDACRFCDYAAVCRAPQSAEKIKVLLSAESSDELAVWKELRQYE
ncbi:MAG: PD-(D/E)XK nuclease family protein [Bacillota bacterium]|jgi:hypothetical protein